MPKLTVIRDASGAVINIGAWDYQIAQVDVLDGNGQPIMHKLPDAFVADPETGKMVKRKDRYVRETEQRALNPLPPGATEALEEVDVTPDGGLRVVSEGADK